MRGTQPAPVFDDLAALVSAVRERGAHRVVLANGCFDPLHVGHVRYLIDAARNGDFLVVAINDDESTHRLKGDGRPVVPAGDRARVVAGLDPVGAVLLFSDPDVAVILEGLRPAVHAKGTDYTENTVPEVAHARRLGIETVIAGDPKSHDSRSVVSRMRGGG